MRFLQGFNPHPVAVRVFILNNCLPVCACLCRLHGRQAFFAQMVVSGNKQRGTGYKVQGSRIKGKPENKSAFLVLISDLLPLRVYRIRWGLPECDIFHIQSMSRFIAPEIIFLV